MTILNREKIRELLKLNNTPKEIALGVSIGVAVGVLPLYGFHTLICLVFCFLIRRANRIAIIIGTNISLPPTVPILTWAGYSIGRRVLRGDYAPLDLSFFKAITLKKAMHFYYPLFVGSLILGLILSAAAYVITFYIVKNRKERRARIKQERQGGDDHVRTS